MRQSIRITVLLGFTIVVVGIVFFLVAPIPQDPKYHQFTDQRIFLGIPNFVNVFSNLTFIIIGVYCLSVLGLHSHSKAGFRPIPVHYIFFIGLILTGFGSVYYHLSPSNQSLVWDRLPMAIAFMSLFSFFIYEHISERLGAWILWPLLAIGVFSVWHWIYTESQGAGDLRWYALVQFLPALLIPLIIVLFPSQRYEKKYLWYLIAYYALAKIAEHYDDEIMNVLSISGHTLKHVFASFAGIAFLKLIMSNNVMGKQVVVK